jgi:capsular polysaccharide biosynthesis protein
VDLNEAVRRILGQHWLLILAFCVLGFNAVVFLHQGEAKTYTAATRVVLDTQDPKSQPESAAIADTAKAIVTSPSQVTRAVRKAGVTGRDPLDIAKHRVSVQALGGSGVLQISVTDRSPGAARAIADALAAGLIRVRLDVTRGQVEESVAALDHRIGELNRRISQLDDARDSQALRAATEVNPVRANLNRAQRDEAARTRDFLAQQRAVHESERVDLLSTLALRPKPSVISPATKPARADATGVLPDMVLGALLGLVLGVGLAGLVETLRPTLVGGDALARELGLPLLGTLHGWPAADEPLQDGPSIAARLKMSAEAAHVRSVTLLAAGKPVDVGRLAERLQNGAASPSDAEPALAFRGPGAALHREPIAADVGPAVSPAISIRAFGVDNPALSNGGTTGLVLVSPATIKKARLGDTTHLLQVSPAPVLGLLAYSARPRRRGHRTDGRNQL